MDKLDKISALALLVLAGALVFHWINAPEQARAEKDRAAHTSNCGVKLSETEPRIKVLKNLMNANSIEKAEALVSDLIQEYPYSAEVHMLKGDLMMRKQDPVSAMFSYREAVDLNPDYMDKKTPDFQGIKIKNAVSEARTEIKNKLKADPDDRTARSSKKTMYYLLRRIAGSCG